MSTDIMLAAVPTPTDADCLDLGALLAPLSREDVELMLVKMINKHPEEAGWIVQAARKPVDTLEVTNEVKTTVATAESIAGCLDEIETHLSRSADFLRGGHVRNCVAMLEVLTPHVVGWLIEQGKIDDLEEEDKNTIQAFTAIMENAWQNAFEACKITVSPAGTAAGHMNKLKPIMGAIFSDPIRVLNKRVKAAQAAAASAPPAAAAAAAGTKRKADAEPEAKQEEETTEAKSEEAPAAASSSAAAAAAAAAPAKPAAAAKPAAKPETAAAPVTKKAKKGAK